jgi:hypothetical protein
MKSATASCLNAAAGIAVALDCKILDFWAAEKVGLEIGRLLGHCTVVLDKVLVPANPDTWMAGTRPAAGPAMTPFGASALHRF